MKSVIGFYSIAEHIIDLIAAVSVYMWWISWRCLCRNFIICVLSQQDGQNMIVLLMVLLLNVLLKDVYIV